MLFYRDEDKDEKGFVIDYRNDDGLVGWFETELTAGTKSKGEVRFTSKGKISVNKKGDFKFTQKPTFTNEFLLDGKWAVDIGVVEGISWEHGAERKTKWHSIGTPIPCTELTKQINLYDYREQHKSDWDTESKISIDFICVRPVMSYKYGGKEYQYQWESFAQDLYYPPRNPDGIYLEFDVPKSEFSRCDVTIDGNKVAENVHIDENTEKGSFFYPFVAADKEYTVRFSFKKPEPVDSEGFVIPTQGSDTLLELTKTVTAGPRAKGEVRLIETGGMNITPNYNVDYFENPKFRNENLLGNNWQLELGLMEGISWEHGDERRTKWYCAIRVPYNYPLEHLNLRDLPLGQGYNCTTHAEHPIDCICFRPIMSYEYDGKEYNYMWDGFTRDVYYPPKSWFEQIDIKKPTSEIYGTWKYSESWDDDYYSINYDNYVIPMKVQLTKLLTISDSELSIGYTERISKKDGSAFIEAEINKGAWDWTDYGENHNTTISTDHKTITIINQWLENAYEHFADNISPNMHTQFKLFKDKKQMYLFHSAQENGEGYERIEVYYKQ